MFTQYRSRIAATIVSTGLLILPFSPSRASAQTDTIRIGSVPVRAIAPGVDTVEVYNFENGARKLSRLSVVRRTTEQYQGRPVLRIISEDGRTRTDARVVPGTLQVVRFERIGAMDSTVFELQNNCYHGWTDLPNEPRKLLQCVPAANRFGSGALDAIVASALPLRNAWSVRVATLDAFGDSTTYPLRVVRLDTVRVGNRDFPAWRVERLQGGDASISGTAGATRVEVKTTWWVDIAKARVLQEQLSITMQGTTRETLRVLRNP